MSKISFSMLCASLVCWCVLVLCFLIALAMWYNCPVVLDYIAAGSLVGGIIFFVGAIVFYKEGIK